MVWDGGILFYGDTVCVLWSRKKLNKNLREKMTIAEARKEINRLHEQLVALGGSGLDGHISFVPEPETILLQNRVNKLWEAVVKTEAITELVE